MSLSSDFSALVANTFTGAVVGNVTGNVTGDATGNITGGQFLPAATAYVADSAIALTIFNATLTKAGIGAYTLAAPGADNVGKLLYIAAGTANAHVITAASVDGGTTLTYGGAVGDGIVLYGRSATAWSIYSSLNVTLS